MNAPETTEYFTPAHSMEWELSLRRSRFISQVAPARDREDVERMLALRRLRFRDATHHCYAWRLGFGERLSALSHDAGEPSGTAGKPILQALEVRRLTNVLCAVTRYFGGTKLGTGGLIRAYSAAAFGVIDRASLVASFPVVRVQLEYDYAFAGAVEQTLRQFRATVTAQDFSARVRCTVEIHRDEAEVVRAMLTEACSGRIEITIPSA